MPFGCLQLGAPVSWGNVMIIAVNCNDIGVAFAVIRSNQMSGVPDIA